MFDMFRCVFLQNNFIIDFFLIIEIEVSSTIQDTTTDLIIIENTTNRSTNGLRELNEDILIEPISSLPYHRTGLNERINILDDECDCSFRI